MIAKTNLHRAIIKKPRNLSVEPSTCEKQEPHFEYTRLMEEMLSILTKTRQTCSILGDRDDSYGRQIREMLWGAVRQARALAEKNKPELSDMIATAETQPTSDDCVTQERNTPADTLER